ncbi:MAG: hypothetical protein QW159_02820 [Desulfurococcaceae archaeon]
MGVFIGKVSKDFVKDEELLVLGTFDIKFAVAHSKAIFIGSGKIGVLAAENCYVFTRRGPVIVQSIHCINVVAVGSRNPIVAGNLRCRNIYARRLIAGRLETGKAVLGEMSIVDDLVRAEKIVFMDPHMYFKKLGDVGELEFAYVVSE